MQNINKNPTNLGQNMQQITNIMKKQNMGNNQYY